MTEPNGIIQDVETVASVAAVIDPQIAPIIAAVESSIALAQSGIATIKSFLSGQDTAQQTADLNAATQKMQIDLAALNAKANS